MELKREVKDVPAANARVGDEVVFRSKGCKDWHAGVVTKVGIMNSNNCPLDIEVKLFGIGQHVLSPFQRGALDIAQSSVVIFPPAKELQRFDPRRKLRSFAQKHKLKIARSGANHDEPHYRLVDPARGYAEPELVYESVEVANVFFAEGRFHNAGWSSDDSDTRFVLPAAGDKPSVDLSIPAGFASE